MRRALPAVDTVLASRYRCATMLRALRFLVWTVVGFVGLSLVFVVLYRFVPIPVTATMNRSHWRSGSGPASIRNSRPSWSRTRWRARLGAS